MFQKRTHYDDNIISSRIKTVICPNCGKAHDIMINVPALYMDGSPACSMSKCMEALAVCECGMLCGVNQYDPAWLTNEQYIAALHTQDETLRKINLFYALSENPTILAYYINYYHENGNQAQEQYYLQRYISDLIQYDYTVSLPIDSNSIIKCPMERTTFRAKELLVDAYRRNGQFENALDVIKLLENDIHTHKYDEISKWLRVQKQLVNKRNQQLL